MLSFDITWGGPNLVVSARQIQLGKSVTALQPVEQVLDVWQRVTILDRNRVDRAVINAHT